MIEKNTLTEQVSIQKRKYNELGESYKKIRGFMHDTKKHLFYIEECVNNKDYDRIIPYSRETISDLESRYCAINTGNLVIDAFVSSLVLQTSKYGITLTTELKFDNNIIPVDDYHMTIIVGNLLDNALNACLEQHTGEIKVVIKTKNNAFAVHVTNTYNIPPNKKTPTDFDNFDFIHGYGLKNVKKSAEVYNGFCLIEYERGIYAATVIIPIEYDI